MFGPIRSNSVDLSNPTVVAGNAANDDPALPWCASDGGRG
jgi:hypothetical protein